MLAGAAGVAAGLVAGLSGCSDTGSAPPVAGGGPTTKAATSSGPRRPTSRPTTGAPEHHGPTAGPTSAEPGPTHASDPSSQPPGPTSRPSDPGGSHPTPTAAHPSHVTSPSASPSPSATPEQPLVAAADVPVGGGVVVHPRSVVVTQPESGTFRGFDMHCTHRGCPVDSVADGSIRCPCHGSLFSVVDGSVVGGPATRGLAGRTLTVHDGGVYLA